MDALIKLQEIAVHMGLEPAEEVAAGGRQPMVEKGRKGAGEKGGKGESITPSPLPPLSLSPPHPFTPAPLPPCSPSSLGVTNVHLPNGKMMPLLKTMMTTACERNCFYCPFRAGRSAPAG